MKRLSIISLMLSITIIPGCVKEPELQPESSSELTLRKTPSTSTSILQWQKCLGSNLNEFGYALAKNAAGYLVAGTVNSADNAFVAYYNQSSGIVNSTVFGGSGYEHVKGVVTTDDGGFLVVGSTSSSEIDGHESGYDIMLAKFSAEGNKEWVKAIGAPGSQQPQAIIKTVEGGFAICGYSESELMFVKIDASTSVEWQVNYLLPGSKSDVGYSLVETSDAFIVGGRTLDVNNNPDVLVVKIDKDNITPVGQKFGDSNEEICFGISTNASNSEFIITGRKSTDLLVVKLDAQLNFVSQKTYGGSSSDIGRSIIPTSQGYLIVGYSNSKGGDITNAKGGYDLWCLQLDNNLNKLTSHNLGGNKDDAGYSVIADSDGYVAAGYTNSTGGDVSGKSGGTDMWLVKFKY